jgi:NitT/TauT family transport system permease protein
MTEVTADKSAHSASRVDRAGAARPGTFTRKLGRPLLMVLPWIAAIAVWYMVALSGFISSALVPTPGQVFRQFWRLLTTQRLWFDMLMSSERVLLGLATGITLAVPIGFVLGWYRPVRTAVDPLVHFFRALPPISLIPLVIVYFGIGEVAKIVMLFYAAFFTGVIVMYEGIVQINPLFIRVARTLGATDAEVFRRVIIPLTVPHVLTAVRVALGVAWATLVASELIAAQRGLGAVIQNASNYFQIDVIYAGIICIGVIALLMDRCLRAVGARLVRWQERIVP